MTVILCLLCLSVGAAIGFGMACLCSAAGDADREMGLK